MIGRGEHYIRSRYTRTPIKITHCAWKYTAYAEAGSIWRQVEHAQKETAPLQRSVFCTRFLSYRFLLISLALSVLAQLAALYWGPLQFVLKTEPLDGITWLLTILAGGVALFVAEVDKLIRKNALIAGSSH